MDLFALDGVNKGAFSHHVIAPYHPITNQKHRTISRLRKEGACWNHLLERWNDARIWCSIMLITLQILETFRKHWNIVFLFFLSFYLFTINIYFLQFVSRISSTCRLLLLIMM
jgi:hypothetical protein